MAQGGCQGSCDAAEPLLPTMSCPPTAGSKGGLLQTSDGPILGWDDDESKASRINLASVLTRQSHYKEVEQLCPQELQKQEGSVGMEHVNTVKSMSLLAIILQSGGKGVRADAMESQGLDSILENLLDLVEALRESKQTLEA
jgi:hypothetical protein